MHIMQNLTQSNVKTCKMAFSDVDENYFPKSLMDDDRREWVPLSLTLVEYPKGDALNFFCSKVLNL